MLFTSLLWSCNDEGTFDNKVFNNTTSNVSALLVKANIVNEERSIQAAIASPENRDISIHYQVDLSLVPVYNQAYYDTAIVLPEIHYELVGPQVVIVAGSVRSTEAKIVFKSINELDRDLVYVLPITIGSSDIPVLSSASTHYFVFRGGALINVVADMEKNYLHIDKWVNPDVVNNLNELTMEALIRARDYDRLISSVMGIEGRFLIRIGDAGFPSSQIQLATSSGNFPRASVSKVLPINEWIHVALTYNTNDGKVIIYIDGKVQSESGVDGEGFIYTGPVHLGKDGKDGFYLGYSYENSRYMAGEFSECRIWNIVRTEEEIANNIYEVDPNSEGLVAYWKCNEGEGNEVKDHTGNENHLVSKDKIKWNSVSLPSK